MSFPPKVTVVRGSDYASSSDVVTGVRFFWARPSRMRGERGDGAGVAEVEAHDGAAFTAASVRCGTAAAPGSL